MTCPPRCLSRCQTFHTFDVSLPPFITAPPPPIHYCPSPWQLPCSFFLLDDDDETQFNHGSDSDLWHAEKIPIPCCVSIGCLIGKVTALRGVVRSGKSDSNQPSFLYTQTRTLPNSRGQAPQTYALLHSHTHVSDKYLFWSENPGKWKILTVWGSLSIRRQK